MSAFDPVRIGLLGFGTGGRYFHAPLLASAAECQFLGVVTRSPDRRAEVHESYPGCSTFDDLAGLAGAGAEAVAISTPAAIHAPLIVEALRLGLAVVCDKPFTLDANEARHVVAEAARQGLVLSAFQNRRWDSDFLTLSALLQDNALGTVLRMESEFERFEPTRAVPAAGGGTLLDFGSHLVDQALQLFGPAEQVYAELNVAPDSTRDNDMFLALTHRSGVRSHLRGSWVQGSPERRFRVTGSSGTYTVEGMDVQEAQLRRGDSPRSLGQDWGLEPHDRGSSLHRGAATTPVPLLRGRWDLFYPAFAAAVRGEGRPPIAPVDPIATAELLDAARRSAATGQIVVVSHS